MHQKVFFFDPKRDKPLKHDEHGLYGTDEIQKIIYENQFPKDCSERDFLLIPGGWYTGIGAYVHVIGSYIARGIELNRTVVYDTKDNHRFLNCPQCSGSNGFDCYFQPVSSCKFTKEEINYSDPKFMRIIEHPQAALPESVRSVMQRIAIPPELHSFYWRVQSAYFITRFSDNLTKWVKEFRNKALVNPKDHYDVSMHIRKGDKYLEMKLIDTSKYLYPLEVLNKLIRKDKISVFISSDDQQPIDYFLKFRDRFDISYYNFSRRKGGFDLWKINDFFDMSLSSFANLEEAVNADYVIGTLSSNWNRLILELNMQYYPNATKFPYLEVGDVQCLTPYQCEVCNKTLNFGW
ncbi:mitochondrial inner membrane protein required for protein import [Histomonas meleagridis]|uniref:mitochondrial inner membrane protein required for protein import n=1 Tax=Histomonas meleagridis TaxID=135588 RepID=UPI00355AA3F9|nr:mitochondrial inner membrane protein required for protein import [Histomonas meleagridis]KAH0797244.1 mitochondrial inner membrane protein required for protein import [Histomonas meleagridis]